VVGLRGRRVDDHPLCRRCGFDLTGRPDESTRCAECGADLARRRAVRAGHRERRRAVRAGHRERRRGPLTVGTLLLLATVVPAGIVGGGRLRGVDWNRYKPQWWLMSEADGKDVAASDLALAELLRRMTADGLSDANRATLVARALDQQGDPAKRWLRTWGEVVEQARAGGHVSDEQWVRYLRQAIGPEALTLYIGPETFGTGEEISLRRGPFRIGRGHPALVAFFWVPTLKHWGQTLPDWSSIPPKAVHMFGPDNGWSRTSTAMTPWRAGPASPTGGGERKVTMRVKVCVFELPDGDVPTSGAMLPAFVLPDGDGPAPGGTLPETVPDEVYKRTESVVDVSGTWRPSPATNNSAPPDP
jgi:hypothetical protein